MNTNKTLLAILIGSCFGAQAAWAEEIKTLSPVVVTATRVEQDSFDLPMAIDKVEKKDIEGQLRMTLSETLARVPGITAQSRNQLAQDPQISSRGFGARSAFGVRGLRVYVDGIPLSMPDGIGNPGSIDLGIVSSVEVMRGPFSAMYGNSSGGVIQMFTEAAPATPQISAEALYGSFNTERQAVSATGTQKGVEYLLNYSNFSSDGYRQNSASEKRQATAKIATSLDERTKLTTMINWFDQTAQDPGGLFRTGTASTPGALTQNTYYNPAGVSLSSLNNLARVIRSNTQVGFNLEHQLDANNTLNAVVYAGQRDNLQYIGSGLTAGSASSIARDFYGAEIRLGNRGALMGKPYSLNAGLNAGFMIDQRLNQPTASGEISGTATRDETQKAVNFDQFVQGSWAVAERIDLHAGVRQTNLRQSVRDRYTSDAGGDGSGSLRYDRTIPVAGLVFKASPTLNLYANYGQGFETPTMIELSYSTTAGAGPNLSLKPSTSTNLEVGSKWLINDDTRVNLALFDISTENEIVIQSSGTYTVYNNTGTTRRNGAELSAETRLPNNFGLFLAYTMLDARFDGSSTYNAGKSIPGTYATQVFAEATWKYQPVNFLTGLEFRHNSRTYVNDANSDFAPSYTILSLRASLQQQSNNWRFTEYVRIDNLADEKTIGSVRINDSNSRSFEPAPGRNWLIGVKANYIF